MCFVSSAYWRSGSANCSSLRQKTAHHRISARMSCSCANGAVRVPLQFDKMSMPSTCAQNNESVRAQHNAVQTAPVVRMQNFLLYVFNIEYAGLIDELIVFSLHNVSRDFFEKQDINNVIGAITTEFQSANVNAKLQLFFLLLNVDVHLKCLLMHHEHVSVQLKLIRFFDDLRMDLVPKLFTDDRITSNEFVQQCVDLYIIS